MQRRLAVLTIWLAPLCALAQNASTPTSFTYTQVPDGPLPCVGGNRANGINQRGDIVGRCKDRDGLPRSWVLAKGITTPTLIDFSGAPFTPNGSTTRAINDRGDIVGRYFDGVGTSHGYLLSNGVFTAIDVPFSDAVDTDARGINDPGVIVGTYHVLTVIPSLGPHPVPVPHGFVRDASGTFTKINFPGAVATSAQGINNSGYVLSRGVFTTIDFPGATATLASGINEQGQIAGSYTTHAVTVEDLLGEGKTAPDSHGFLRSSDGAAFTAIDFPNASATNCRGGINDHGNIVGVYVAVANGPEHGFVTSR